MRVIGTEEVPVDVLFVFGRESAEKMLRPPLLEVFASPIAP